MTRNPDRRHGPRLLGRGERMSADVIGPVEGVACPECGLIPTWDSGSGFGDVHAAWCPRNRTCGQTGPPWVPLANCHRDADWLIGPFTVGSISAHKRRAHTETLSGTP